MKQPFHSISHSSPRTSPSPAMPTPGLLRQVAAAVAFSALALCIPGAALGQTATNANSKSASPKAKAPKKGPTAPPASPGPEPVSVTPSRFVGEAEIDAYVASLAGIFSMRGRATDPFGQYQDPESKPVIKTTIAKKPGRTAPAVAIQLSEIVQRIKVTTIMPREKKFLVGNRAFKLGDRMPITFRTKTIALVITAVNSHQIDFRNPENNETASLKMDMLPAGMTPGTRGITAPGMVSDSKNAPLELDDISLSTDHSLNR